MTLNCLKNSLIALLIILSGKSFCQEQPTIYSYIKKGTTKGAKYIGAYGTIIGIFCGSIIGKTLTKTVTATVTGTAAGTIGGGLIGLGYGTAAYLLRNTSIALLKSNC